jgi:G:T-mismatch repair DNA endonuclease (very short patch repair protein)
MPVITNTHLKKHGLTPEQYYEAYRCEFKTQEILVVHSKWMRTNNPNLMPGVKEKQSTNNAMKNPLHKGTHKLAVNDPAGQLKRHLARKKRAIDSHYTSYPETWLADYLGVPSTNRRFWVYGAGEVDLAFPELKVAIEVQGCYWHGCLECGYVQPGNKGQRERDSIKASKLQALGWILLTVWEHEINPYLEKRSKCA